MTSKHTPGPWRWAEDHPKNACVTIYAFCEWGDHSIACLYEAPTDDAGQDANGVWGDHPERRANARLIAAAPDLLEALREMVKTMPDSPTQAAIDAIAKAEGRA